MPRSILVAVDGTETSMEALDEAIAVARATHGRLTLISVAAPPRCRGTERARAAA